MKQKAIVFNIKDNVATALDDLTPGEIVEPKVGDRTFATKLTDSVPFGHKFSLTGIGAGSAIVKYGEIIGIAVTYIGPGSHVHVHNVDSARGRGDLTGGME